MAWLFTVKADRWIVTPDYLLTSKELDHLDKYGLIGPPPIFHNGAEFEIVCRLDRAAVAALLEQRRLGGGAVLLGRATADRSPVRL